MADEDRCNNCGQARGVHVVVHVTTDGAVLVCPTAVFSTEPGRFNHANAVASDLTKTGKT